MMATLIFILSLLCANVALISSECKEVYVNKVTPEEIQIIVNKHNELRNLIMEGKVPDQPKGINLKTMKWDVSIASEAQKIANTCKFQHVAVDDPRWYVGQNLFKWSSTGKLNGSDWNMAIKRSWFSEHKNFVYPNISNGVTGHYTQVVWADTEYVGCGYVYYPDGSWNSKFYVCNYGPGGNIVGVAPYKIE